MSLGGNYIVARGASHIHANQTAINETAQASGSAWVGMAFGLAVTAAVLLGSAVGVNALRLIGEALENRSDSSLEEMYRRAYVQSGQECTKRKSLFQNLKGLPVRTYARLVREKNRKFDR